MTATTNSIVHLNEKQLNTWVDEYMIAHIGPMYASRIRRSDIINCFQFVSGYALLDQLYNKIEQRMKAKAIQHEPAPFEHNINETNNLIKFINDNEYIITVENKYEFKGYDEYMFSNIEEDELDIIHYVVEKIIKTHDIEIWYEQVNQIYVKKLNDKSTKEITLNYYNCSITFILTTMSANEYETDKENVFGDFEINITDFKEIETKIPN